MQEYVWDLEAIEMPFKSHPMYHMWCEDLKASILKDLNERDDPNLSNLVATISGQTEFAIPNNVSDAEFYALWVEKSECLVKLYRRIQWMLERYTHEPHLADVKRERYDHALDYLSGQTSHISRLLTLDDPRIDECGTPTEVQEMTATIAREVIEERSVWVARITEIECIRVEGRDSILTAWQPEQAKQVVDLLSKRLHGLILEWTSISI